MAEQRDAAARRRRARAPPRPPPAPPSRAGRRSTPTRASARGRRRRAPASRSGCSRWPSVNAVAALAQAVADEPRVEVVAVPDHQRTHGATVRGRATVAPERARMSAMSVRRHGRGGDARRHPGRPRRRPSAVAKHTPVVTSVALSELTGGDVVLKAESLQRTGAFKIRGAMNKLASLGAGGRQRRDGRQRRQPRPGAGVRRPPLRRAVRHLRAGRRADHQDRGLPGLRRRRSSRAAPRSTRRSPPPGAPRRRGGHGVLPPVRRPRRRRRPGHARPRAASTTSPTSPCVVVPARRRRAGRRAWPSPSSRCCPHVRVVGVQAAVCAPYAGGAVAGRAGADAGRRHRRQAPGRAHRAARRASGSTRSSPSTRTPSPTPWSC